jgi:hypothetical protein
MLRYGIDVPQSIAGPELRGAGLAFTSCKPRENGTGLVLRCANLASSEVNGVWRLPKPAGRALRARLDETPTDEIPLAAGGREIPFKAGPRAVVTILIEKREEGRGKREE